MRAWRWIARSRTRLIAALLAVGLVALLPAVLRSDGDGGEESVEASSVVEAGERGPRRTTTTKPAPTTAPPTTVADDDGSGGTSMTLDLGTPRPSREERRARDDARRRRAREELARDADGDGAAAGGAGTAEQPPSDGAAEGAPDEESPATTTPGESTTTTTTSPDTSTANGRIVVVHRAPDGTPIGLAIVDPDGTRRPLTDERGDRDPAWSPDGTQVAFTRDVDGEPAIFVVGLDGSEPRPIVARDGSEARAVWRPDGNALAFVADGGAIGVLDATSGEVSVLDGAVVRDGGTIAWSPDGLYLAWTGEAGIEVAAPDGTDARRLTTDATDGDLAWAPEGDRMLVQRGDSVVMVAFANGAVDEIADGDPFTNLDWSPDGEHFLHDCVVDDDIGVCSRRIDGTERTVIVDGRGTDGDWAATR